MERYGVPGTSFNYVRCISYVNQRDGVATLVNITLLGTQILVRKNTLNFLFHK